MAKNALQSYWDSLNSSSEGYGSGYDRLYRTLAYGFNSTDKGKTALHHAVFFMKDGCEEKEVALLNFVISKASNLDVVNLKNHTPLYVACENCSVGAVEILLKAGAKVNYEITDGLDGTAPPSPLVALCIRNSANKLINAITALLHEAGVKPSEEEAQDALIRCIYHRHYKLAEFLIKNFIDKLEMHEGVPRGPLATLEYRCFPIAAMLNGNFPGCYENDELWQNIKSKFTRYDNFSKVLIPNALISFAAHCEINTPFETMPDWLKKMSKYKDKFVLDTANHENVRKFLSDLVSVVRQLTSTKSKLTKDEIEYFVPGKDLSDEKFMDQIVKFLAKLHHTFYESIPKVTVTFAQILIEDDDLRCKFIEENIKFVPRKAARHQPPIIETKKTEQPEIPEVPEVVIEALQPAGEVAYSSHQIEYFGGG